jgi:hypothetical protein
VFEGDDHWDSVALHAEQTLIQINAIIQNPILLLPSLNQEGMPLVSVAVDVYCGADLSNAGDMLCGKGCNCSHPYTQCKQPKGKMCSKERAEARTLVEIKALAHVEVGLVCPACKKIIVDKEKADLDVREVKLAKPGEEPPCSHVDGVPWDEAHIGIFYPLCGHQTLDRVLATHESSYCRCCYEQACRRQHRPLQRKQRR